MDNIFVMVANLCHIIHFPSWLTFTSVSIWHCLTIKPAIWACRFSYFVICNCFKGLLYQSPWRRLTQLYLRYQPLERLVRIVCCVTFILCIWCMVIYIYVYIYIYHPYHILAKLPCTNAFHVANIFLSYLLKMNRNTRLCLDPRISNNSSEIGGWIVQNSPEMCTTNCLDSQFLF